MFIFIIFLGLMKILHRRLYDIFIQFSMTRTIHLINSTKVRTDKESHLNLLIYDLKSSKNTIAYVKLHINFEGASFFLHLG